MNEFTPDVTLSAENVPALCGGNSRPGRIKLITLRKPRRGPAPFNVLRLVRPIRLRVIEIAVGRGGHDDVVPGGRCVNAALRTTPGHHHSSGRKAALEDFIPADHPPAFGC